MNSEFKDLLKNLEDCRVRYLVVGGHAVMFYSEPRYTKDIDLWIAADRENAKAVFQALKAFGAPLAGMTEDDFAHEGTFYQIGMPPARIDILMSLTGLDFTDAWSRKVEGDLDGTKTIFISKQDLIASKRMSGRRQDLIDAELLELSDKKPKHSSS